MLSSVYQFEYVLVQFIVFKLVANLSNADNSDAFHGQIQSVCVCGGGGGGRGAITPPPPWKINSDNRFLRNSGEDPTSEAIGTQEVPIASPGRSVRPSMKDVGDLKYKKRWQDPHPLTECFFFVVFFLFAHVLEGGLSYSHICQLRSLKKSPLTCIWNFDMSNSASYSCPPKWPLKGYINQLGLKCPNSLLDLSRNSILPILNNDLLPSIFQ